MDLFTHGATGALIGWALPQRRAGLAAAPLVVAGALLPDADVFIEPFVGPRSVVAHRGFTHSLLGVAVLAPLVALVALRFSKEKRLSRLVPLIAIGMLSHVLLDLPTPMGVMLFSGVYLAQIMPVGAPRPTFTFFPSSIDNPFVARTRSIPEVRRFLSAARFPVTRYRLEKSQHIIEYQDYGPSWRPLLRVVLNERQEVLAVGRIAH